MPPPPLAPELTAMPFVVLVKKMSVGGCPPPLAGLLGIAVLREKLEPPSLVESSVPSRSRMKPSFEVGNDIDWMFCGQRSSLGVNGSRWNVVPPSSLRRAEQPPPITTDVGEITSMRLMLDVMPVGMPVQVAPASEVLSSVPKSPAA